MNRLMSTPSGSFTALERPTSKTETEDNHTGPIQTWLLGCLLLLAVVVGAGAQLYLILR
jgi:hypothetical protein